jgi:predicted DNA-binding transcriptional regulator AlpA
MPDITAATTAKPERFLRTAVVCDRLGGIDTVTLWRGVKKGWIPKPVRLDHSSRMNLWRESEIDALMASRPPGGTWRPDAAIAANARRRANKKAAKEAAPAIRPNRFTRRAP